MINIIRQVFFYAFIPLCYTRLSPTYTLIVCTLKALDKICQIKNVLNLVLKVDIWQQHILSNLTKIICHFLRIFKYGEMTSLVGKLQGMISKPSKSMDLMSNVFLIQLSIHTLLDAKLYT